jgi:hypothetical protein
MHNPNITDGLVEKVRYLRELIEKDQRQLAEDQRRVADGQRRLVENQRRLDEWESVLAKVQTLQREEQPRGKGAAPVATVPDIKGVRLVNKAQFVRDLLKENALLGLTPADIRKIANDAGLSVRTSYPYKTLTKMVDKGEAFRDEQGRYYPLDKPKESAGRKVAREQVEVRRTIN